MMNNTIVINIQNQNKCDLEIKNEITSFLDKYQIYPKDIPDDYREYFDTYLSIDNIDIKEMINNKSNQIILSFRIPGATRGGIILKELSRTKTIETTEDSFLNILYKIIDIEFIDSTCFEIFKVYKKDVINDAKKMFCNNQIIINFKL